MSSIALRKASFFVCVSAALILAATAALAQEDRSARVSEAKPVVTATGSTERVRIAAPSAVVQLRLEIYDDAGQKLFDTEQRGGNVLDWHLQNSNGGRVADGLVHTARQPGHGCRGRTAALSKTGARLVGV